MESTWRPLWLFNWLLADPVPFPPATTVPSFAPSAHFITLVLVLELYTPSETYTLKDESTYNPSNPFVSNWFNAAPCPLPPATVVIAPFEVNAVE